jgi:hypothetical protein
MRFIRVRTGYSREVNVTAGDYWDVLLDWEGILKWMPTQGAPVPLVRVELEPGHVPGRLPCTRNCYFDVSALPPGVAIPECVPETLLHVDPVARTIYYNMEGQGPFGMRNYLAVTEVDEVGPQRTRVTCSGRFDLPEDAPAHNVKAVIEGVYASIVNDIPALIVRRAEAG